MSHPIQCGTLDEHFSELVLDLARLQPLAEDRLVAKDGRLRQAAPVITTFAFPCLAPHLPDPAQIFIPHVAFSFGVAVLPDARAPAGRDRRLRLVTVDRLVALAFILAAITADRLDLPRHIRKQLRQHLLIAHVVGAGTSADNLLGLLVHTQVQLAPGAAFRPAVLPYLPFPFAIHLHPR